MKEINKQLAELLFPNITSTVEDMEKRFPERTSNGACVTRFAPSPTGYMHIGGLYVSIINENVAKQKNGTFFLRIEDTDQSRILENGVTEIINTLNNFDINFNEGPKNETEDFGEYGPYRQSLRKEIYQTYAKYMVEQGMAYPCFCTKEDLEEIHKQQTGIVTGALGYTGEFARCRNISPETAIEKVKAGIPYVIRLKSPAQANQRMVCEDLVRGKLEMDDNNVDIVIIKSDGLPTYHFAHVIDDHLMHTTHVIRADEWISSLPLHIQMFKMLNFKVPKYAHVCPILKMDGTSKRKLSKRKDPEARVGYYHEQGFPIIAVKEYLLNLINSRFEMWREQNPKLSYKEFKVNLTEMSSSGALFDFLKLSNISKKIIKNMSDEEVLNEVTDWAKKYSQNFYEYIMSDCAKFQKSIEIWHKNRMDVAKWNEIENQFAYLYDSNFINNQNYQAFELEKPFVKDILSDYLERYNHSDESSDWFEKIKQISEKYNYAVKMKEYKQTPELFNGSVADVSTFIRIALTDKKDSPDIYQIQQYLGENEVRNRIKRAIEYLTKKQA